MVVPAMQLAKKIPDAHLQMWAAALLKDIYQMCGQDEEAKQNEEIQSSCTHQLLTDYMQASQTPEHKLIFWTEGQCPIVPGNPQE